MNDFDLHYPLTPKERDEYERDLIRFSDCELDLLGDIKGKSVLYAGGTSPLWIEGLAERIGASGSLTVLDTDEESLQNAEDFFDEGDLPQKPRYVVGDAFELPFGDETFDLVYSSGLLHELDMRSGNIRDALSEMHRVVRSGGSLAASDFVSDTASPHIEEEAIQAEAERLETGAKLYGIRSTEELRKVLAENFRCCEIAVHPPFRIRHLKKLLLAQPEDENFPERWNSLRRRVEQGDYPRPTTVFFSVPK